MKLEDKLTAVSQLSNTVWEQASTGITALACSLASLFPPSPQRASVSEIWADHYPL